MTFYEIVNLSHIAILELGAGPAMASCTAGVTAVHAQDKDIPALAAGVMKVTRLLANNPRKLTQKDAEAIYRSVLYALFIGGYITTCCMERTPISTIILQYSSYYKQVTNFL